MLPGYGGTNAAQAVLHALAADPALDGRPLTMFAQSPYYFDYPSWPGVASSPDAQLSFNSTPPSVAADLAETIEMLNTPANPTGAIRHAVLPGARAVVCDAVFNWPTYKEGGRPLDCDVSVFSLSKLTCAAARLLARNSQE